MIHEVNGGTWGDGLAHLQGKSGPNIKLYISLSYQLPKKVPQSGRRLGLCLFHQSITRRALTWSDISLNSNFARFWFD